MKFLNKKNIISGYSFIFLLGITSMLAVSCNKDINGQDKLSGNSKVTIRIGGISDADADNNSKNASVGKVKSAITTQEIKLVEADGFDAILSLDNDVPTISGISDESQLNKSAAVTGTSNMVIGVKYRVFFYKKNGASYDFQESFIFDAGSESAIEIPKGTYKWVALSYNNGDAIADRGADNEYTILANKDALYAKSSSDILIADDNVGINVVFNRLVARIAIEINTLGMFAELNNIASVEVSGLSTTMAKIDLTTGSFVSVAAGGTAPSISSGDFQDIPGSPGRKVAYIYTPATTSSNLSVKLTGLSIKLDEAGTFRTFGATTLTQKITPQLGKNQRFLINITESAITYGGVKWARSNLYYRTSDALGATTPYRFYHTNPLNPDPNESFFAFRGHLPKTLANKNEARQKDPCALVYPKGLWKTPSYSEVGKLTSNEGLVTGLLSSVLDVLGLRPATPGAIAGNKYIDYIATGTNSAYGATTSATNRLRFNFNGLHSDVSLVEELITLNITNEKDKTASFWSNDRVADLSLIQVGAWGFLASIAPEVVLDLRPIGGLTVLQPARPLATKGAGALNISLVGLDLIGSGFMNVRCVRNSSWAPDENYDPMPKPADWAK